ncbi:hypothetical protein GCM10010399_62340 [Dactylosporangium fulvum]|uniref:Uncharacterized protein n=1 Tax=Dactylosporangium fulvum TaxID=53359 RepID=A0ABY5VXL1_9ACTN|nr:hypothetical protein [Dactylosporangium fulvum]UWP82492.1 hypothetical protein Dfulv_46890 [Dactylosporangium fulvum]
MVVCTSWDSAATATAEADKQRTAYPAEAAAEVKADGKLVRAVSTAASPRAVFDSLDKHALPGVTA